MSKQPPPDYYLLCDVYATTKASALKDFVKLSGLDRPVPGDQLELSADGAHQTNFIKE